ncbi:MAG: Eco57I restriction-modification methylase domain-containing protein [Armatimonadota bacterium]
MCSDPAFPLLGDDGAEQPVPSLGRADIARALGVVHTPDHIVEFMVHLAEPNISPCDVLEPACADAPFLQAFTRRYGSQHRLIGVEIHPTPELSFATLYNTDFLLWDTDEQFDIIIGNPPYGIIGDSSHYPIHLLKERKARYRARYNTWRGKYNIYGAFIEKAVNLLKPTGKLIFIVPASWLVLDDFKELRALLACMGKVTVFYLGKVFPKRNVSAVVLVLERGKQGLQLYDGMLRLVVRKEHYAGEMIRFETEQWLQMEREGTPLDALFHIRFAARSPEIRQHPATRNQPGDGLVPVLTGRNLRAGWIDYETCYSGYWFPRERASELRPFYAFPHLVVAHTKGTSVVAAVEERCYPWREEFHLLPKEEVNLQAVSDYLNSEPVQRYVRSLYRDFVPHLTATMLRSLPIPQAAKKTSQNRRTPGWQKNHL